MYLSTFFKEVYYAFLIFFPFLKCVTQVCVQVKGPHQQDLLSPTAKGTPETTRQ